MIYNSLRILPMVICMDIINTGDITLLSDEEKPIEELAALWEDLFERYQAISNSQNQKKVFNLSKEIDFQENRYELINYACECLLFDRNEDFISILQEYSYTITDENYIKDIEKIQKQSGGILIRINQLKDSLPKPTKAGDDTSIIDVMASYSSILGFDFDFFTCSVEKFYSLEKMVKAKTKSIELQNTTKKKK